MRFVWILALLLAAGVLWWVVSDHDTPRGPVVAGAGRSDAPTELPALGADAPLRERAYAEKTAGTEQVEASPSAAPAPFDGYGLDVIVADPDGIPVEGVGLWLYGASARDQAFNFEVTGETDAEGRACLHWKKSAWDGDDPTAQFELSHSRAEDGTPLSGDIRTHPPVRIAFPAWAHVHLHVVRPDGKPAETAMKVDWYRPGTDGGWQRRNESFVRRSTSAAKFRFLDPEEAHAFRARGGKVYFPGPITEVGRLDPRATIEVKLTTGERKPVLESLLLDDEGKPLANAKIAVWIIDMPADETHQSVRMKRIDPSPIPCTTDWLGRFRQVMWSPEQKGRRRWLRLEHEALDADGSTAVIRCHVDLEGWQAAEGRIDLGELSLR